MSPSLSVNFELMVYTLATEGTEIKMEVVFCFKLENSYHPNYSHLKTMIVWKSFS